MITPDTERRPGIVGIHDDILDAWRLLDRALDHLRQDKDLPPAAGDLTDLVVAAVLKTGPCVNAVVAIRYPDYLQAAMTQSQAAARSANCPRHLKKGVPYEHCHHPAPGAARAGAGGDRRG